MPEVSKSATTDDIPEIVDPESSEQEGRAVTEPARVMRIGSMIRQLLDEVRQAPLDEASRDRLRRIYETSVEELGTALSPELRDELARLTLPFNGDTPSESELRIAQAQLVGWLEGLFHGMQAALFAQQMEAREQLQEMRSELPPAAQQPQRPAGGVYL
jgi:Bacterial proteasome activator